jgi:hypothetical protein
MESGKDVKVIDENNLTIGQYSVYKHQPIPGTNQVNIIWIQKDNGEGMSVDLDELWKEF